MSCRLILGTVQLGMPYGIANKTGRPSQEAANAIIKAALAAGLCFFDTATGYGESEQALGAALEAAGAVEPKIVSKLSPQLDADDADSIPDGLADTLSRLKQKSLYAMLLHREEHLPFLNGRVGVKLTALREKGLFSKLGVSVYTPDAALAALEHPLVSIIQFPASIFDRRFEQAGVFDKANELRKEAHVRSVLLQGVLTMQPDALPSGLSGLAPYLKKVQASCEKAGIDVAPAAIAWALRHYPDAFILFGAETPEQVRMNMDSLKKSEMVGSSFWEELDALVPPQIPELLNPSLWGK